MCNTHILAKTPKTEIGQCCHCSNIFLWHNNVIVTFTEHAFLAFHEDFKSRSFDGEAMLFTDNVWRVSLGPLENDLKLIFSREEWLDLENALDEATLFRQVYAALA